MRSTKKDTATLDTVIERPDQLSPQRCDIQYLKFAWRNLKMRILGQLPFYKNQKRYLFQAIAYFSHRALTIFTLGAVKYTRTVSMFFVVFSIFIAAK